MATVNAAPPPQPRRAGAADGEQTPITAGRQAVATVTSIARARMERGALLAQGPELRDLSAAIDCSCACHPRAADMDLHDGGTSCYCQLTREQRQHRFAEFEAASAELRERDRPSRDAARARFDAAAAELGVEANIECLAAPFAITGRCDGLSFFLRARHGLYRVELATDPDCESLWHDGNAHSVEVASGDDEDLAAGSGGAPSAAVALRVAVDAIRTATRRAGCDHEQPTDPSHLYCRRCGIELARVER